MKRTLMFVGCFALLASIFCGTVWAQCPGGNCSTYTYSYGWWPWVSYQYQQPAQAKTCNGAGCRRCAGPACAKVEEVDAKSTVPATADDVSESVTKEEPVSEKEKVPATADESGAEATAQNPSLNPPPAEEVNEKVTAPAEPEVIEVPICPFASRVIALINQHRARAGLPPLKADINLVNGCQNHSRWMQSYGFQHASNGGRECIAVGVNTPESLVSMWMNSSGHRAIIMGWGTWIGIGSAGTYHTLRIR